MRRFHRTRAAFTLTELLVVIALIVVLGALGMGAMTKGYGWVKQRATETTMTKVLERIVQRRINDIYKEARDWDSTTILYNQAAGDPRRAEVLKVLYLYKWSFPETYSEAFWNFQESLVLFDNINGYPTARTIYERLVANAQGMTPAQFIATPSAAEMGKVLPYQTSACLVAALATCRASSLDELTAQELSQPDADHYDVAGGFVTKNRILVDGWGNPFFFLRHGNFWDAPPASVSSGRSGINRAAFWCGLVSPPVAPIPAVLGPNYYDILVNGINESGNTVAAQYFNRGRAFQAYSGRWNSDPFDPEGVLRNSDRWRTLIPPAPNGNWISSASPLPNVPLGFRSTHLAPPSPNATGTWQHQDYFRSNFGYRPQVSSLTNPGTNPPDRWPQEYAPFVIISAGGDGLFTTWDDNLDSYRLKLNLAGQQ